MYNKYIRNIFLRRIKSMDDMRIFMSRNVLNTSEASKILGVTQQTVTSFVRNEKLKPIKKSASGLLFYLKDVEELANRPFKRWGNDKISILYLLAQQKRMLLIGDSKNEKSNLIIYLQENLSDRNPPVFFYDGDYPNQPILTESFFTSTNGAIATVPSTDEYAAIELIGKTLNISKEELLKKVDFFVIAECGQFTILHSSEIE
jgi:hypothetical protein